MRSPNVAVCTCLLAFSVALGCSCRGESGTPPASPASSGAEQGGHQEPVAAEVEPLGTVYGADTTTIEAAPGDRFSLALPHDPPKSWQVDPELDQSVTRLVEERTEGSTHYVLFDAVGIGPTDVRVRQRGPDSPAPGPPAREVNVRVRVELAQ